MKNQKIIAAVAGVVILIAGYIAGSFFPVKETLNIGKSVKLENSIDSFSYAYGLFNGGTTLQSLKQLLTEDQVFGKEKFVKGVEDGLNENKEVLDVMQAQGFLQGFVMSQQDKKMAEASQKGEKNKVDGEKYLETNKTREGVVTTASGLQYEVLTKGNGISPKAEDSVTVHYTGMLIDGTVFDSSVERQEPVTFKLDEVIPAWTEGLQLMKEGDKFKLYVPSELAYGQRGSRAIEPNSTLIFEVELLKVTRAK